MSLTITVELFGAFRNISNENHVELYCDNPCSIAQIREAFKKRLNDSGDSVSESLLAQSVFANETSILNEGSMIHQSARLVVLPPISGG